MSVLVTGELPYRRNLTYSQAYWEKVINFGNVQIDGPNHHGRYEVRHVPPTQLTKRVANLLRRSTDRVDKLANRMGGVDVTPRN